MKLRIQNFRSLKDTGDIEIKPITILVGRNSSGKSSFLRTFPMLKQSVQERTISPILLYGDYVDFGSYKDIKPHFSKKSNEFYELTFTLNSKYLDTNYSKKAGGLGFRGKKLNKNFDFKYSLKFNENRRQLIQISCIRFEALENTIKIDLDQESKKISSISINGDKLYGVEDNLIFSDYGEFDIDIYADRKSSDKSERFVRARSFFTQSIINCISKYVHGATKNTTKLRIFNSIYFDEDEEMLKLMKGISYPSGWRKKIANWTISSKEFIELKNYVFLQQYIASAFSINNHLKNIFLNMNYIAPLRATAERYYRIQHLAVNEVDPNGKNLPAFLGSLTDSQLHNFQNWTYQNFSFKTKISKIEGHYSIKIEHDGGYEINLSDMGFGYSQILPILTQIWHSTYSKNYRRNPFLYSNNLEKIIVIEQPELHLHPEFQAKFADSIAKIITFSKRSGVYVKLIIETHSDIIINRLGDCILNESISNDDINIVIFNKKSEISSTEIRTSHYDKEGNLVDWPLGFFQPTYLS